LDFSGLYGFNRDPHPFDLSGGEKDADSLQVWLESPLGDFGDVGTDTATFLGEASAVNDTAADGAFSGD
jgi:hypothetical protein